MRALRTSLFLCALCAFGATAAAQPARPAPARAARVKPGKLDLPKAAAALTGTDLAAAAKAAQQLGASTDPAARVIVHDALATGLHPDVMVAAITALGAAPTKDDLPLLRDYTRFRHAGVRAAALRAYLAAAGTAADVVENLKSLDPEVRAVAASAAGRMQLKDTAPALLILLDKGEKEAALALGAMGDEGLARVIAEHLGTAPDASLAIAFGAMLSRPTFGPEPVRLEAVRTVIKLAGPEAIAALEAYVAATPANPPKQSRREAEAGIKLKLGDGK